MAEITKKRHKLYKKIRDLEELIIKMQRDKEKYGSVLMDVYEERLNLYEIYRNLKNEYPIKSTEWDALRQIERELKINIIHVKDMESDTKAYYSSDRDGLDELMIMRCNFVTISKPVFEFHSLKRLTLIDDQINNLPDELGNLENLRELNLNCNKIKRLPDIFSNLYRLEILILNNNKLKELPESLFDLQSLTQLYLGNNELKEIPNSISRLEQLDSLVLNNNKLTELPETISQLKSLSILDLSSNLLKYIPIPLMDMESLKFIGIQNNPLVKEEDILRLIRLKNKQLL